MNNGFLPLRRRAPGFTLIEVIIAAAIFSIGVLGFFNSFNFIGRAIQATRGQTLATNLAQERIEDLKNNSYYALQVTTITTTNTEFDPVLIYSNGAYGPVTSAVGGINFTIAARVDFAAVVANQVSTQPYTDPDPGMKQIVVYVVWKDGRKWKKFSLTNLIENPNVAPQTASFAGAVTIAGGGNLGGAKVNTLEVPSLQSFANASGAYSFSVSPGTYTLYCSSEGYYANVSTSLVVNAGGSVTQNFTLTKIATGTVTGEVWKRHHQHLISYIVASTFTMIPALGVEQDVEFVELFNPTTSTINIDKNSNYPYLLFYKAPSYSTKWAYPWYYTQTSTFIAANGYFLIANTSMTFALLGSTMTADMWYSQTSADAGPVDFPNLIEAGLTETVEAGSVTSYIYDTNTFTYRYDAVGWRFGGQEPPWYLSESLRTVQGLRQSEQIVRFSTPAWHSDSYGRAYNTDNNRRNFNYNRKTNVDPMSELVYNVASGTRPAASGVPVWGAIISVDDQFSNSTVAYTTVLTTASGGLSYYYSKYRLEGVSTGTWTVNISSAGFYMEIATVTVSSLGATVTIPSTSTVPSTLTLGTTIGHPVLLSTGNFGYVSGFVRNTANQPLSGIQVVVGGLPKTTNTQGFYSTAIATGPATIIFNPNNVNPLYTSEASDVTVTLGIVSNADKILSRGGTFKGYVTSGQSALPNMTAVALRSGSQMGSGASDTSGNFYIYNLATGAYTVQMALDPVSSASPANYSSTVLASTTVFVGTFTVTGAFGTIRGSVKKGSTAVKTGAIIIASTVTIASSPPAIDGVTAPAARTYYATTSASDGTYELLVRGSTWYTYSIRAWYTRFTGETAVTDTVAYSGASVGSGGSATQNITFP